MDSQAWFEPIRGQALAVRLLSAALRQNKLAQSYLFYGPEGVGKSLTALRLGMAVQCEQDDGSICGVCTSCRLMLRSLHPDWHVVQPEGAGNFIRIDQVRDLQTVMSRRPNQGRRRIAVLESADRMNEPAANALLKLLEEPPEDSLLILITSAPQRLLPTISSRCQPMRFTTLSIDDLAPALAEELTEQQRLALLRNAQGSMGRLLRLSEDQEWDEDRKQAIAWFTAEPRWDTFERLHQAEILGDALDREACAQVFSLWQSLYRDRLVLASGGEEDLLWNPDALQDIESMPYLPSLHIKKRINLLQHASLQIASNTSIRAVLESLFLRFEEH